MSPLHAKVHMTSVDRSFIVRKLTAQGVILDDVCVNISSVHQDTRTRYVHWTAMIFFLLIFVQAAKSTAWGDSGGIQPKNLYVFGPTG